MGKDELVVLGGERSHHETEDVEEGAEDEERLGTVVVEDFAKDGPAGEHAEGFEGGDPGDGRGREVPQEGRLVVFLEDADACLVFLRCRLVEQSLKRVAV